MSASDFPERVRAVTRILKAVESESELDRHSLPIQSHSASLVHVCGMHREDRNLVAHLGSWRARRPEGFFTRFPVTEAGTARWLARIIEADEHLFFFIRDSGRQIIGHAGLTVVSFEAAEIEVDNVVRGNWDAPRGIITDALRVALAWTTEELAPQSISVRVLEDNEPAVSLYRRVGFEPVSRHELRRHQDGARDELRPIELADERAPDGAYLRMMLVAPEL